MLQNGCPQAKEKTKHFKIELTSPDVDMSTWSTSLILSGDNEKEVLERVDLHINSGLIVKNVIEIVDTI
jgi:hypothetical protein